MDAIILAAGLGTRLRPHTLTTPKPMLPVRGRPILDWTLGALPGAVDRVVVVVHHLGEQIEAYLASQKHVASWEVVRQETPRGTGDALRGCQSRLRPGASFLVLNGDDLYGAADLAELAALRAGLLCQTVQEPSKFGIAYLRANGTLERLVEKPADLPPPQLANTGAYLFPPEVFEEELTLSPRGEYEITQYVSATAARSAVGVVKARFWLPIGDEAAWKAAQDMDLDAVLTGRGTRQPRGRGGPGSRRGPA
jgi:bifunctional UDP-N-acetylglucosamine pyrophosphorylase/glucosamine-1-phosphate N-acetyltransferase